MRRYNINNKDFYVTELENSTCKWAFVVENGVLLEAQVVAPISEELGSKFNINYLDEENFAKYTAITVDNPHEEIIKAKIDVQRLIAGQARFNPERMSLRDLLTGGGHLFRNSMIKNQLGLNDVNEEEYSRLNTRKDNINGYSVDVNYAQRVVKVELNINLESKTKDSEEQSSSSKKSVNIVAPKSGDFKG